jgi:ribonucleotide monophosphatase NagD (HAD superfamily)
MLELSSLPKTWLIDIDGTLLRHNGYLSGKEEALPGALAFIKAIPSSDRIVLLTARPLEYETGTHQALQSAGIRYDQILFGLPTGERILINDAKPSGLQTAYAVNLVRDAGLPKFDECARIVDK